MPEHAEQFEQFWAWIRAFDTSILVGRSEAEVRSQFVVPFFLHLGYPSGCWREEYTVTDYDPEKGQAVPRSDFVYFSTREMAAQTEDTSLIVVEAKRPGWRDLERALHQARYYALRLGAIFLVATDGHRLLIVRRPGFRSEERLLDAALSEFQDEAVASRVYRDMHFDMVGRLKALLADPGTYQLYVNLIRSLDRHPDLREQLARDDFRFSQTREGRELRIVEPKVAITCTLPLALGEGECHIEFSSLLLRGLTCHLTHWQILADCMRGLGTPPACGVRPFLKRTESGLFETRLGQMTVMLSGQEAVDLCTCIDVICQAYRIPLEETESVLETWNYTPAILKEYTCYGFRLHSVTLECWKLMLRFAHEFDCLKGESPWHVFNPSTAMLRVVASATLAQHALLLYPAYRLETDMVDLMYGVESDIHFASEERFSGRSWKQDVGPRGWWTAPRAEDWLVNTLIPHVLAYYEPKQGWDPMQFWRSIKSDSSTKHVQLDQVEDPKHLAFWVQHVQRWLQAYAGLGISASLLQRYYKEMAQFVQHISSIEESQIEYCYEKMAAIRQILATWLKKTEDTSLPEPSPDRFQGNEKQQLVINCFLTHANRIQTLQIECADAADYLSRAFAALLSHATFHYQQNHLNALKDALRPLVDLSRFEGRYVLSHWQEA